MNRCTECNFPLEEGLLACPQCGADIPPRSKKDGTINVSAEAGDRTVDFEDPIELEFHTHESQESGQEPASEREDEQAGSGTVSAPGVEANLQDQTLDVVAGDQWDAPDEIDQTVDAGLTELDEADDFDFDDDFPGVLSEGLDEYGTVDANGSTLPSELADLLGDSMGTVNAFGMPDDPRPEEESSDPNATHVSGSDDSNADLGNITIDMAAEERPTQPADAGRATVDAGSAAAATPVVPPTAGSDPNDDAGTVVLPGSGNSASVDDKTIIFESTDSSNSTVDATGASGASGTEGRLKRLWEGVAGSSENPMHSLQAIGLQASDSIFQRVATRRVADASVSEDVTADYQIVDKLGEGAMGIVFSARQTAVNRIVAIKTAKPNFQSNDESRRRFLYEAHITADLDHSNIVPIHELGASEEGMLFYSMKLVQGTEWSRVMRKKTREQNLEIFMKVTDAMAFAHSKGVIHRDLKPENTMLGRFGEVFVTDWGTAINLDKDTTYLAKPAAKGDKFLTVEDGSNFVRGDSIVLHDGVESYDRVQIVSIDEANHNRLYLRKKLTRDYQPSRRLVVVKAMNLAGTPCYMAPEMAGHRLPKIGKTCDIYILGAILYDLVTGKPPHTGDSVTQCLRAALKNDLVVADSEDPLMKIAYKAMATEPAARYQTVEELQEAVREYRRHAESIALTERSDELLVEAIEKRDYDTFSRTLFGYRDAIDLWPENTAAVSGLKKARLAFGQAAYSQGNFDLALQTLDREVPEEATLLAQASQAKKKVAGREASLRLLQKVIAAVVLFAIVGLSALAWIANDQRKLAVLEKNRAEQSAEQERQAKEKEAEAKVAAQESETKAKTAETKAVEEAAKALLSEKEAIRQQELARMSEMKANQERRRAEEEEVKAKQAAELAQRRSAQIQLGEYKSSLALAKSQIESFDLAAGAQNLQRLRDMFGLGQAEQDASQNNVFFGNTPKIDSWGWQRIELLGNLDLPKAHIHAAADSDAVVAALQAGSVLDAQVNVSACAPAANCAVVGTKKGLVQLLQYDAGKLSTTRQVVEANSVINAVAISPDGQEVVFSYTRDGESGVKRWDVNQSTAQPVAATQKRAFQYFAYSTDGKQFVGGISGGLWLWDHDANWFLKEEPKARVSIRGELTNLQSIGPQHTLLTTRFQDKETLVGVLDHSAQAIVLVKPSQTLPASIRSAEHTLVDDRVVLGLSNNALMVGKLAPGESTITELAELADKHRAPVTHIVSNGINQLITSSVSEPVAHVWHYDAELQAWEYDTYLTGTPKNIEGVGLLGEDRVLAVDAGGTAIVWNVERQKQRRRMQRMDGDKPAEYNAPVQAVIAGPSDGRALAIDSNGVIDLWSLTDGQTERFDGNRWSYIGHTPGAELVNSAIDVEHAVVVTAASLKNARKEYLADPTHTWEFCSWDTQSGAMRRRWSAPNREVDGARQELIEQRVSLVDSGRQVLFASDSETRLVDLASGQETFERSDFGSYFAVPNPSNAAWVMLVKRSGAVRLLEIGNAASWDDPALRNFALADPSDIPLNGVWSNDGHRFYLTFSTGGLAVFHWTDSGLELGWSTRALDGRTNVESIASALSIDRGRIQSHLDVDLAVTGGEGSETLTIATRRRGLDATTKLVSLKFSDGASYPSVLKVDREVGVHWLQVVGNHAPSLVTRISDSLVIDESRIRSRLKVNNQTFVSATSAQVLELTDDSPRVTSYGRTRLISATGNKQGTALWALLEDGSIWKFAVSKLSAEADSGGWTRLGYSALGASHISLSPDAGQMLIVNQGNGILVDPESGRTLAEIGAILAAAWDPGSDARLAVCRDDRMLEILSEGQVTKLAERPLMSADAKLVNLSFFNETWADPALSTRQFLLVHSEQAQHGALQFVAIDAAPEKAASHSPETEEIPLGTRVAVSPTENILVTGAPGGTVAVWFAAPTHDPKPQQLFDLEGHRGEQLTCITFSSDGRTIVTADTKNRLFAWLSSDPLVGNAPTDR
ncbi:MAG: protein kinase [Pirellulaceae bacterium]|nr:protein kinase [Pirellulaceae bacterium]